MYLGVRRAIGAKEDGMVALGEFAAVARPQLRNGDHVARNPRSHDLAGLVEFWRSRGR
jgi:hypothetical protein